MKQSKVILTAPHATARREPGSSGAENVAVLWITYILQYSCMAAAFFFLWKEPFIGFLACFFGAYLPAKLAQKLERPSERFKDEVRRGRLDMPML
ncbi:MAG TPA: hypothetical protein VFZ59_12495 [Verrucomicrobiae bacterium]|nr:hypothetical protein [Verrucomicrobiae bacterium]